MNTKRTTLALVAVVLIALLVSSFAAYANPEMAANDNPGPTSYPGNGAPWAQPPKGKAPNDNPGPTSYPGNGAPWAQPPKGKALNTNPGPTSFPGNGAPWAQGKHS